MPPIKFGIKNTVRKKFVPGSSFVKSSASKNSMLILNRLGIAEMFDAIIDGTKVSRAKPDPEVFLAGAQALGLQPEECIVFEDAVAGVRAAHNAGMKAVGIGTRENLPEADIVIEGLQNVTPDELEARLFSE